MDGWAARGRRWWARGRTGRSRGGERHSAVTTTSPKSWVPTGDPAACPVPEGSRQWIEHWLDWCVGEFGARALHGPAAVPGPELVPPGFTGTQEQAEALVGRVARVMGVPPEGLTVRLFESSPAERRKRHTVGTYRRVMGRALIELDRTQAENPVTFTAIVAHELAHARLLGERRLPDDVDGECLTDLLTVFLGMGVFTAGAAYEFPRAAGARGYTALPMADLTDRMLTGLANEPTSRTGYLSEDEFGYALAYWTTLRGDPAPAWTRHLTGGMRAILGRGVRHLATRGVRSVPPPD